MTINMILYNEKSITIKQGVGRVIEMNGVLHFLHCLKHKEEAPVAMHTIQGDYTDIALCTIVLSAVNLCTLLAIYASVQNKFLTDITMLSLQSTRVFDKNKEYLWLLNDSASRVELKTNDSYETRVSVNTATKTILVSQRVMESTGSLSARRSRDAQGVKSRDYAIRKKYLRNPPTV